MPANHTPTLITRLWHYTDHTGTLTTLTPDDPAPHLNITPRTGAPAETPLTPDTLTGLITALTHSTEWTHATPDGHRLHLIPEPDTLILNIIQIHPHTGPGPAPLIPRRSIATALLPDTQRLPLTVALDHALDRKD